MQNDNQRDPFNDKVQEALRARDGEKQQQPERSVADSAQEHGPARQQGASPDRAEIDRFADTLKKEWGIGKDGKRQETPEHAQGHEAGERSDRPTAQASRPEREQGVFERTVIDKRSHVGLQPHGAQGQAWEKFAKGTKDALGDFVSRVLYGEPGGSHEPAHAHDKGMDR